MERLTKRKQNREPYIDCNKMCADWHKCDRYKCRQIEIVDKLAEYEDLEEQGLLLKLPCKVGDTVFSFDDRKAIHPFTLEEIEINEYGQYILIAYNGNKEYLHFWKIRTPIENIGKTVFLTKAEAEKALEEMEK